MEYFTTGEMAELCGISKQTLFHYDKIGLLPPTARDDNNKYRSYSIDSFEIVYVIKALQFLGMSLTDIKDYLDKRNPEHFAKILESYLTKIDKEIARLQELKLTVKERLSLTDKSMDTSENYVIAVETHPEIPILCTYNQKPHDQNEVSSKQIFAESVMNHIRYCHKAGMTGPFSTIIARPVERADEYSETPILYCFSLISHHLDVPPNATLIGGKYAVVYCTGQQFNDACDGLFDFIEKNNYKIKSDLFESAIVDEFSVEGYDKYLLKMFVAIED